MECVAISVPEHSPANESFQFTSYFSTVLEISLVDFPALRRSFSRPHVNTELQATPAPSDFVTGRPQSLSFVQSATYRLCPNIVLLKGSAFG